MGFYFLYRIQSLRNSKGPCSRVGFSAVASVECNRAHRTRRHCDLRSPIWSVRHQNQTIEPFFKLLLQLQQSISQERITGDIYIQRERERVGLWGCTVCYSCFWRARGERELKGFYNFVAELGGRESRDHKGCSLLLVAKHGLTAQVEFKMTQYRNSCQCLY